jgi:hypothetical protein
MARNEYRLDVSSVKNGAHTEYTRGVYENYMSLYEHVTANSILCVSSHESYCVSNIGP